METNKRKNLKNNNLRVLLNLLKYPLISDKATRLLELNKYSFMIDKKANKYSIKKIIEYIFNVSVVNVNTLIVAKKKNALLVVFQVTEHNIKKQS